MSTHPCLLFPLPRATLRPADTRRSAVCLSIWSAVFLPWFLFYVSVGDRYLDPEVYRKLDVTRWGINDYIGI